VLSVLCAVTLRTTSGLCLSHFYYFASGRDAQYFDERVCVSACMSLHLHISKMTCPDFTKSSVDVTCGRGSVLLW